MQRTLVITDLTQMPNANEVCIVGIDEHSHTICPVLPNGVLKRHLYQGSKLVIRPRAKVEFKFNQVPIQPPHKEDLGFEPNSIVFEGLCTDVEWEKVLRDSSFDTVEHIYGGHLRGHRWVEPGANTRSIGTLSQAKDIAVQLPKWDDNLRYRLSFKDKTGFLYEDIPISDLAFRELSYFEVVKRKRSPLSVSDELARLLSGVDCLYLRLGLACPWTNPNTGIQGCWMQITGIHSLPDYLGGKSFADFSPIANL